MLNLFKIFANKILVISLVTMLFLSFFNVSLIVEGDSQSELRIDSVNWDGIITEDELTEFTINIKNSGSNNFTDEITVLLYIDDQSSSSASNSTTKNVNAGESISIHLDWIPTFGDDKKHRLIFVVNDDFDNIHDIWVKINERDTNLEIINIETPDIIYVNETVLINASVVNNGADTDKKITATFNSSIDDNSEELEKKSLKRDETCYFNFNWTPSKIGIHNLNFSLFLDDELHVYRLISVNVTFTDYDWWNENWHYRYIISLTGEGNYSQKLNFTKILDSLNVPLQDFENHTIRIIKYSQTGEVIDIVTNYNFTESNGFNKIKNATGSLKWKVPSGSDIKYYAVYFDVEANIGNRAELEESFIGDTSEGVTIYSNERYEGWWAELQHPSKDDFILAGDQVNISLVSKAKIFDVAGFIYYNKNQSLNYSLDLIDYNDNINWYNNSLNFSKEGNWTINVTCLDNAGFYYNFSSVFYIGKTDLRLVDIEVTIADNVSYTSFHKNDSLNITAYVETLFASVKNVNVTLTIFDTENEINISKSNITYDFLKDTTTTLTFNWKANVTGVFDVIVFVDYDDKIAEKDETNNKLEEEITVSEWPDLWVKDIILPTKTITEFDEVKITAKVKNNGLSDAENYKIGLFIEKKIGEEPIMSYENMVYSKIIDVKKNSTIKQDLFWNSASPGYWSVGVKVFWNESKYDLFQLNNMRSSPDFLYVNSIESGKPIIRNVAVAPSNPSKGDVISITAEVYDNSGLKKVEVNITNPLGVSNIGSMVRTTGDRLKYVFDETDKIGEYSFVITAVDDTAKNNFEKFEGKFVVENDKTDPIISYFGADPIVQLAGKEVTISCIVTDDIEISDVEVEIVYPDGFSYVEDMQLKNERYVYKDIYSSLGQYSFFVTATDTANNRDISSKKYFWITDDLDDYDKDGIPNSWEKKYNLNIFNASDADLDLDNDGYTNLEEYNMNTNPRENILIQNIAANIRENVWYLVFSIIAFLAITFLSIYGRRRIIK